MTGGPAVRPPMPVTFVCHTGAVGGAEIGLVNYLRTEPDIDATVVIVQDGPLRERVGGAKVRVLRSGSRRLPRPIDFVLALPGLRRALRGAHGVVVATTVWSAILCRLVVPRSRPVVLYLQDVLEGGWISPRQAAVLRSLVLPRVDAYMVNSRWTAQTLPPRERSTKPVSVVYTPSGGGDVSGGDRTDRRAPRMRVVCLSRLSPWKGQDLLMDAVLMLREQGHDVVESLTLAGGAHFGEDDYVRKLYEHPLNGSGVVRFTGHVEDVSALLAEHDVLVCPSTSPEPFGQVIVQGMSAGLAVAATSQGGPAEILEDGVSGVLVRARPEDWADALTRLADPGFRTQVARAGRARAERFSDAAVADGITAAIGVAARGRQAGAG